MEKRVKLLVCDSGAFIKSSPVHEYAENIYTVKGAVAEIKDKETLKRLQFLPYTLQVKEPSAEAFKHVSEFAKKTGDFSNLSLVDLQVIALTYQLEKENVGTEHLNEKPTCQVTKKPAMVENEISGFYFPKKISTDSKNKTDLENPENENSESKSNANDSKPVDVQRDTEESKDDSNEEYEKDSDEEDEEDSDEEDEEDSDEESWITSSNIAQVQMQMGGLRLDAPATVACVTTDFCIQNVLKQMGLNVVSVNGMLIQQTRVFILRCFSCYKTTSDTEKKFCPSCGNRTLKRVAVTVNEDGSKNIHINFRRPMSVRGFRYSLPTPKGGKHSADPVLCEDQPIPQNRLSRKAMQKTVRMNDNGITQSSPFALNDIYSRAANLGIRVRKNQRRRNPNEWSIRTGNKK